MPSIYGRLADALQNDWKAKARPEQLAPEGDWSIWLLLGGRGFGKTLAAAQHIREIADSGTVRNIGLVGQTASAIRDVMVLGPSGIMSIVPNFNRPVYEPSRPRLPGTTVSNFTFFRLRNRNGCAGRTWVMPGATSCAHGPISPMFGICCNLQCVLAPTREPSSARRRNLPSF